MGEHMDIRTVDMTQLTKNKSSQTYVVLKNLRAAIIGRPLSKIFTVNNIYIVNRDIIFWKEIQGSKRSSSRAPMVMKEKFACACSGSQRLRGEAYGWVLRETRIFIPWYLENMCKRIWSISNWLSNSASGRKFVLRKAGLVFGIWGMMGLFRNLRRRPWELRETRERNLSHAYRPLQVVVVEREMEDKQVLAVGLEVVQCSVVTSSRISGSPAYILIFMRI